MTNDVTALAKLDIGKVIKETFDVIRGDQRTFLTLTIALAWLPAVVVGLIESLNAGDPSRQTFQGGLGIVTGILGLILLAALVAAAGARLKGETMDAAASMKFATKRFWPLLGLSIVEFIAIIIGLALLVVPGLILAVMWAVVAPAFLLETSGVFKSFGRSRALTKGNRWRILGLVLIYFVFLFIVGGVSVLLAQTASFLADVVITPVLSAAAALFSGVGATVLYAELKRLKEGSGAESLAAVFD